MEFQTLIENRRSVRKYSSHTNVTKEQIQQLVQAALEAPSWKNTETGRYYCVLSEDIQGIAGLSKSIVEIAKENG